MTPSRYGCDALCFVCAVLRFALNVSGLSSHVLLYSLFPSSLPPVVDIVAVNIVLTVAVRCRQHRFLLVVLIALGFYVIASVVAAVNRHGMVATRAVVYCTPSQMLPSAVLVGIVVLPNSHGPYRSANISHCRPYSPNSYGPANIVLIVDLCKIDMERKPSYAIHKLIRVADRRQPV